MKLSQFAIAWIACAAFFTLNLRAAPSAAEESQFYQIVTLQPPPGVVLEAGGFQMMPDGRVAVCTRNGDIYLVEGAFENPPRNLRFKLYASGLHEPLGLALRDGWLYVMQRGELTRTKDVDGDGRADLFETVSDDWGLSGDYHEYAFSSKFDKEGYLWAVLCLTGSFSSDVEFRGWCLRISPDGKAIPTTSGIRSPGGIGTNAAGDMFYTDNQGPWNGACALKQLVPGQFVGHPGGNRWYPLAESFMGLRPTDPVSGSRMHVEAKKIPQLVPPAIMFPYNKMGQSASGIACDLSQGKFGPFQSQLFIGDQTHSTIMRVHLEKVKGRYQGACFPFKQGFDSGCIGVEFAPDGSLFVGGSDRGWGARGGKPFAMQRLIWTGRTPFEIHEMRAKPDGFELTFTQPVDRASAEITSSYSMEAFTHIYQSNYGSPEVDKSTPSIQRAIVAQDGRSVRLIVDGIVEGHIHELHLPGLRSAEGKSLLHSVAYYTLNNLPAD